MDYKQYSFLRNTKSYGFSVAVIPMKSLYTVLLNYSGVFYIEKKFNIMYIFTNQVLKHVKINYNTLFLYEIHYL